jgi:hypothetical protein
MASDDQPAFWLRVMLFAHAQPTHAVIVDNSLDTVGCITKGPLANHPVI